MQRLIITENRPSPKYSDASLIIASKPKTSKQRTFNSRALVASNVVELRKIPLWTWVHIPGLVIQFCPDYYY